MYVLNPPSLAIFDLLSFHGQNTLVASFDISKVSQSDSQHAVCLQNLYTVMPNKFSMAVSAFQRTIEALLCFAAFYSKVLFRRLELTVDFRRG